MLEQLREFTAKWYGEVIPNKTDLCSFSLKTLYAVVKFGGLVALVLQPIVFGPLMLLEGSVILRSGSFIEFMYCIITTSVLAGYIILAVMLTLAGVMLLLHRLYYKVVGTINHHLEGLKCGKTITFK